MNRSALRRKGSRMRAKSMRRLAGGAGSLLLLTTTMLASAGIVQASPPHWVMDVTALPASIQPDANAGYEVTITNNGPSNISALYLVTQTTDAPIYVDDSGDGRNACTDKDVQLKCSFGALNANESVTVTVAYDVSATAKSYDPGFEGNTTGEAFKDPSRSHGDALVDLDFTGTTVRADKNFGGSFNLVLGGAVFNAQTLTGQNKQATKVENLPSNAAATVEDGPGATGTCTTNTEIDCSKLFGEWSLVNVGDGGPYASAIVIKISYKSGTPTAFVHSGPGGFQELVGLCPSAGFDGIHACFTWDGTTASIYTNRNGGVKGIG
jgi:hypothetical protein